jgi:hypothetical protein
MGADMKTQARPRPKTKRVPIIPFRLEADSLADLETIREWMEVAQHGPRTRADAARFAIGEAAKKIREKNAEQA